MAFKSDFSLKDYLGINFSEGNTPLKDSPSPDIDLGGIYDEVAEKPAKKKRVTKKTEGEKKKKEKAPKKSSENDDAVGKYKKIKTSTKILKYLQSTENTIETSTKNTPNDFENTYDDYIDVQGNTFYGSQDENKKTSHISNNPQSYDITPYKMGTPTTRASPGQYSNISIGNSPGFNSSTFNNNNTGNMNNGFMSASSIYNLAPNDRAGIVAPPQRQVQLNQNYRYRPGERNYEFAHVNYWTNTKFEWSDKLLPTMDHFFGYRVFRSNQKAIINAVLSKRDVFVCMPTGGGKSLTFQLPAIIDKGVTLVIMPLLALIYDQVTQMEQKNIEVINLSSWGGQVSWSEYKALLDLYKANRGLMEKWKFSEQMPYPKMIFTTPEKVSRSSNFMNFLKGLYNLGILDRIVIDEAHCVSQWGHDFRKDYLNLKILKEEFPDVSVMALTATAPENVKIDVIYNLKMNNPLYFQNSFNRPNLIFEVRPKTKNVLNDIVAFIKETYPKKTGIIYTATIKEAEQVCEELKTKFRLKAEVYHASLTENQRNKVHHQWLNDEINIVVATIAFGMGINKLDVRFVIHHTFSKSIANYYQEAGRAGRDGLRSHCIIYYREGDKGIHEFFAQHSTGSMKNKQDQSWEVTNMIRYCEEMFECRRVLQLAYFGEKFKKEDCKQTCDNCKAGRVPFLKDVTAEAKIVVEYLMNSSQGPTSKQLTNYLFSGKLRETKKSESSFGSKGPLRHMKKDDISKLIKELLYGRYIHEKVEKLEVRQGAFACRLYPDRYKCQNIINGKDKIFVKIPEALKPGGAKETKAKLITEDKSESTKYTSTHVEDKPSTKERVYYRIKEEVPHHSSVSHMIARNITDLDKFSFKKGDLVAHSNPPSNNDSGKAPKKKYTYSREYGYCTAEQFEEILERLKIVRKRLVSQLPDQTKASNPDIIMPIEGLYEFCRKLPTSTKELTTDNIKNVGAKQLKDYGSNFLAEIEHFVKVYNINKDDFLIPKDIDNEEQKTFDIQEHLDVNNLLMSPSAAAEFDIQFGPGSQPMREMNINQLDFNHLDFVDEEEEDEEDEIERAINENYQFNKKPYNKEPELQKKTSVDDDLDEEDLDLIEEMLKQEREAKTSPAEAKISPQIKVYNADIPEKAIIEVPDEYFYKRVGSIKPEPRVPDTSIENKIPPWLQPKNKEKETPKLGFFDLLGKTIKSDAGGDNTLKRSRTMEDGGNTNSSEKLKQLKFL